MTWERPNRTRTLQCAACHVVDRCDTSTWAIVEEPWDGGDSVAICGDCIAEMADERNRKGNAVRIDGEEE